MAGYDALLALAFAFARGFCTFDDAVGLTDVLEFATFTSIPLDSYNVSTCLKIRFMSISIGPLDVAYVHRWKAPSWEI